MTPRIKRTYGSRVTRTTLPSSPASALTSPPKRKRQLEEDSSLHNTPSPKKRRLGIKPTERQVSKKAAASAKAKQGQKWTQLHFSLDTSILRTCPLCDLSYTKGAPDDESLHRSHCIRVRRGLEWGREEERELSKSGVEELSSGVKLKNGVKGRIICFRADVGGRIGAKLTTLLDTISLALTSPPLSTAVLQQCKIYIFLLPSATSSSCREKIVGCVIAQRISTAMAIASAADVSEHTSSQPDDAGTFPQDNTSQASTRSLIPVDSASNLYVHPAPLPTPLGIPRLFVSSSHRRLGIASHLLSTATATFILGCPLDPAKGEVAFTQPTGAGKAVLEAWGKGAVRIYEEEQGQ